MNPKGTKKRSEQPESLLVGSWKKFLTLRGWFVKKMHGSQYQAGFPDLYITHPEYRARLVEIKTPARGYDPYTPAQLVVFKLLSAHGSPVWTLTGKWSTIENHYIATKAE